MKIIIKFGIFVAIMVSSYLGMGQSPSNKVYDTFSGKEGVVTLSFSKSALKPFEVLIDDETKKVVYRMEKVSFLFYNEQKGKLSALNVYNRIKSELNDIDYFEINPDEINCNDCDIDEYDNVSLIGRGSRYSMNEFHLLVVEDDFCMLLSFYGDITVDDLKEFGKFSRSTQTFITQ